MTVKELRTLIDNLDEYIHVPGGIERLKKTVLHLAVSGQLVPQDPSEGTGEELHRQIQAEKERLVKEGKLKKQKPLPEIAKDEIPFETPRNWKWVRLDELMPEFQNGASSRGDRNGVSITVLRLADIKNKKISLSSTRQIPIAPDNISRYQLTEGDILVTRVNGSADIVGQFNLCDRPIDAIYCDHFIRMRIDPNILDPYFCALLGDSSLIRDRIKELFITTAGQKTVNQRHIGSLVLPIMPVAEQKRIVNKVDAIFALIDELANKYKAEQAERKKLVSVALASLSRGDSELAFTHLTEIIHTKADAAEIRKTILHLAVSGQLVPQDPAEGTGEELYKQIQIEKTKLVREGKLKPQKTLPPIKDSEMPFEIPQSWKWVRIRDAGYALGQKKPDKDFNYIDVASVDNKRARLNTDLPLIQPINAPSRARKLVSNGTVIYSTVRPYLLNTAIIENNNGKELIASTAFAIVHPYVGVMPNWILYNFLAPYFVDYVNSKSVGAAYPAINDAAFDKSIIPLPPLAEQNRIVQKTTQLLDLITQLEQRVEK